MDVALIGYGYWGKIVQKYIEESSNFNIKYICSKELKINSRFINDIQVVIDDPEIEAIFLCTPVDTHFELCRIFLENGKHVFCEKPTVKNYDDFIELEKLSLINQKILFTDYIYTVSPSINYIKEHIDEIGRLKYIAGRIEQYGNFYKNDSVYEILGVHLISAILYLTDEEISSIEKQDNISIENCLIGHIFFKLESGCEVNIECSLLSTEKVRKLTIYGECGFIEFSMNTKPSVRIMKYVTIGHKVEITNEECNDFDENNNLSIVIDKFSRYITEKDYTSNLLLSKKVLKAIGK